MGRRCRTDAARRVRHEADRAACAYELEGSAELRFAPEGLVAEIVFPVT